MAAKSRACARSPDRAKGQGQIRVVPRLRQMAQEHLPVDGSCLHFASSRPKLPWFAPNSAASNLLELPKFCTTFCECQQHRKGGGVQVCLTLHGEIELGEVVQDFARPNVSLSSTMLEEPNYGFWGASFIHINFDAWIGKVIKYCQLCPPQAFGRGMSQC